MRDAIESGDEEGRKAAAGQFLQTLSAMNPAETLGKIHMPHDVDGFEAELRAIMLRIPPNWGRSISCSRGWHPILVELDRDLAEIDPTYTVHQVKEKFGTLRYYCHASESVSEVNQQLMDDLVREAETRCEAACEFCGEPGSIHVSKRGWYRTLCGACAAESAYERVGELVNDLGPDISGVCKVTCYAGGRRHLLGPEPRRGHGGRNLPPRRDGVGPAERAAAVAAPARRRHRDRVRAHRGDRADPMSALEPHARQACPWSGWAGLYARLIRDLRARDPDLIVEEFGGAVLLIGTVTASSAEVADAVFDRIEEAEDQSQVTCVACGGEGSGWPPLCEQHEG